MIQPNDLLLTMPMKTGNDEISTTQKVWEVLWASYKGDLEKVKQLVNECEGLVYAQYNYAPPIHFAVREGHTELVSYLLEKGAHDPSYKFYPFQESLQTVAADRGYAEIEKMLDSYAVSGKQQYYGDNGEILYNRTNEEREFEKAVDNEDVSKVEQILKLHPEFAKDQTYFWGEGILLFAVKEYNKKLIDLLMDYGATVPVVLKWAQFYYFERCDAAKYIMEKGMSANTQSWQHVTLLHDMAQKGFLEKAALLIDYGADVNAVDEAYQTTPLGMAARWGQIEMVKYLLSKGADVNKAGATWATPLAWAQQKRYTEIETILKKVL